MDTLLRPRSLNAIDNEIERLANQLGDTSTVSDDYAKIADNLRLLCDAREKKNDRVISSEALLSVAANIVGLLIILNFEKTGIITSKAMSFLWKQKGS